MPERKVRCYGDPDHDTHVEVSWSVAQRIVHPTDAEDEDGGEEE